MNNTLKTSVVLLTLSLALSTGGVAQAQTNSTSVTKNAPQATVNAAQTFSIEINGASLKETGFKTATGKEPMVPLRAISEALGFELTWNGANKSAVLVKGAIYTTVKTGEDVYTIAKMNTTLGTAPQMKDSTLYVPASFVSEILQQNMTVEGNSIVIGSAEQHMSQTGVITAINNEDKYQSVQIKGVGTEGIVLNVGEDTVFEKADGSKLTFKDLHIGMTVKAEHAMFMTMSLPPQTPAYTITVQDEKSQSDLLGTTGTIEEVEKDDKGNLSIFIKGDALTDNSQKKVVLNITADTVLINGDGETVKESELVKGAQVIGFYSPVLTRSLPPIGTAEKVVINAVQE